MSSVAEEADVRAVTALLAIRCMPPCVGCDGNNHGIGCVSCNGYGGKGIVVCPACWAGHVVVLLLLLL